MVWQPTDGDLAFEEFCRRAELQPERIPVHSRRTPDYRVPLQGVTALVEVKQVEADPEMQEIEDRVAAGEIVVVQKVPGQYVRPAVKSAAGQLRDGSIAGHPGILVLYDVTSLGVVEGYDFLTAMYGLQAVIVNVPHDARHSPSFAGERFVGRRSTTSSHNTSISAVGWLRGHPSDRLELWLYHNFFARRPLSPSALSHPLVRHFAVDRPHEGPFKEWVECTP